MRNLTLTIAAAIAALSFTSNVNADTTHRILDETQIQVWDAKNNKSGKSTDKWVDELGGGASANPS